MALPRRTIQTVRAFAREKALFRPGPLLVAVSGGTDSTALLLILRELAAEHGLVLHVGHFDHRTRPRASAADAAYVAELAARCGAPLRIGRADAKPASEDAARTARYAFLRRAAGEIGASSIATGHTRDDQAETVLLRAARGSGLAGIAAMRPLRDGIARPLLAIGREETAAVCLSAGIAPREDPSNRSLRFARNRVRHRVLPELARVNPRAAEALARLASSAAEATDGLRASAEAAIGVARDGDAIDLDRLGPDPTVRGEAIALVWQRATGRPLSARTRAALATEAARRDGTASLDLPGGSAVREYASLRIVPRAASAGPLTKPPDAVRLSPDEPITFAEWTLVLTRDEAGEGWSHSVAAPPAPYGLHVRTRQPGDRMAGRTRAKVQDLLTDAKIPARRRDSQPLVVTASGEIWWIPGVTTRAGKGEWRLLARKTHTGGDASDRGGPLTR